MKFLLTTINSRWQRISMHGVRQELLKKQAEAVGIELVEIFLPEIPSMEIYEREQTFAATENIPSIRDKAEFCLRWIDSIENLNRLETKANRKQFLLNLICFAACIEGLFFFAAVMYVYFLRLKTLLHGLAAGRNWIFRDEWRT